jgi:hypothetical protein
MWALLPLFTFESRMVHYPEIDAACWCMQEIKVLIETSSAEVDAAEAMETDEPADKEPAGGFLCRFKFLPDSLTFFCL